MKIPVSGFRPLTNEMQAILVEADKPKKWGKKKDVQEGTSTSTAAPKKRKTKKAGRKAKSSAPSESKHLLSNTQSDVRIEVEEPMQKEGTAATSQLEVSQPSSSNPEVILHISVLFPITDDFIENASIPSPTATTSTPITIAPCLPPVTSQVPYTLASSIPMFTNSTATTTTMNMTNEPPVTTNASNAGVGHQVYLLVIQHDHFPL